MTFHSSFIPLFLSTNIFMFSLHINSHIALLPNIFQHLLHQNLSVSTFSNCPYFSIPYINTHHSDQFRTLLLAPYCHHKFQLLFVSRPFFSKSSYFLVSTFHTFKPFSISLLYGHFLFIASDLLHSFLQMLSNILDSQKNLHNVTSKIFLSPHEHLKDSISAFPETPAHGCSTY